MSKEINDLIRKLNKTDFFEWGDKRKSERRTERQTDIETDSFL
jgi:hypothetical protein